MDLTIRSAEILKDKMPKVQRDCQSQVTDLINKLYSWRDESHRQMSDIISYHSRSIDEGFNNLFEEFSHLQAQVSTLRKERGFLLESVDNLNHQIGQMNDKVMLAEPEQDSVDLGASDVETPNIREEFVQPPSIRNESKDKVKAREIGYILEQCAKQQSKRNPTDDQNHFNDSTGNELDNADVNDGVKEENEDSSLAVGNAVELQDNKISTQQKLQNKRNSHGEDPKVKCEQCPFETSWKQALNRHIRNVHDRIRSHVCGECGYSFAEKSTLRHHVEGVHKKIRKHVCEECGFSATQKSNIRTHMRAVHSLGSEKTEKMFHCEDCNYFTKGIKNFRRHRESVHRLKIWA